MTDPFLSSTRKKLLLMAFLSTLLFSANYLSYLALYVCLAIDYLGWRRKEAPLSIPDWLVLLGPQVLLCGLITLFWNPLQTDYSSYLGQSSSWDRVTLFIWNWRDINHCEFLSGTLFLATVVYGLAYRDRWIIRGAAATIVYVAFISAVSPQILSTTSVADVRYLVPLIPLFIAIEVRFLSRLAHRNSILALGIACIAFSANLLNGGPLLQRGLQFTPFEYARELIAPNDEPYSPVIDWINRNVSAGQSVLVQPDYMVYSLMFHAPHAIYAWQFPFSRRAKFPSLPTIHFQSLKAPDYLIAFGPTTGNLAQAISTLPNHPEYTLIAKLENFGIPLYRPELFWRTFRPINN